jgi:mono/diheme cytochrome c family protein
VEKLRWFLIGVCVLPALLLLSGFLLLRQSGGFSAREQPNGVETWVAGKARAMAIPATAASLKNPVTATASVLDEAREHWADHCAGCHANNGSGDSMMGKNMYPPAPDMRQASTQRLTDGELFFIIQNGVRLTGMPGWTSLDKGSRDQARSAHDAEDSWKLVHFVRHLPQLTLAEEKEMEKLNPKGPADRLEEEQEEKFLRGESNDEPTPAHHHHD